MKGLYLEDLHLGQSAEISHTVTDADIRGFAEVSGDRNPVHLDEAFAASTPFKSRIAHGMLSGSWISAVLGTQLPGPGAIYLSQSMRFKRPVRIGDQVLCRATVTAIDQAKAQVTLATVCEVKGKPVVEGEAVVLAPRRNGGGA
jgi:3-hydroxybutyryl-CoA dehydratase